MVCSEFDEENSIPLEKNDSYMYFKVPSFSSDDELITDALIALQIGEEEASGALI